MATFNRENQSGRNRNFGKTRFNNDRPDMHKATCAKCGKICEVPFRPTGNKPVYCRDCFKSSDSFDSHTSENRNFRPSHSEDRQMYTAICANCGNSCQIPFRPSQGREIFCSRCFEKRDTAESQRPERRTFEKNNFKTDNSQQGTNDKQNYTSQFEALNAKLDKILTLVTPMPVTSAPVESAIDEKVINEIAEEVKEDGAKKPKKVKTPVTKTTAQPKKTASSKKE